MAPVRASHQRRFEFDPIATQVRECLRELAPEPDSERAESSACPHPCSFSPTRPLLESTHQWGNAVAEEKG